MELIIPMISLLGRRCLVLEVFLLRERKKQLTHHSYIIGRLRVNMGNICVKQGKFAKAIKMYRMALDQIPDVHKVVRLKILQNIGIVFVKMGRFADAITSFEHIMEEKPNFKTGNSA